MTEINNSVTGLNNGINPINKENKAPVPEKTEVSGQVTSLSEGDTLSTVTKEHKTALQKHVSFFDQDNDGIIHVSETYKGLRDLHLGRTLSAFGSVFINAGLGQATGEKLSDLTVNIKNIAAAKHDSDTDIFDEQGNFSETKFEELFEKYDLDKDGALSKEEFINFRMRNKESSKGAVASKGEFDLLVVVAGQETKINGKETKVISKEQMKDFYLGSLFYKIAGKEVPKE